MFLHRTLETFLLSGIILGKQYVIAGRAHPLQSELVRHLACLHTAKQSSWNIGFEVNIGFLSFKRLTSHSMAGIALCICCGQQIYCYSLCGQKIEVSPVLYLTLPSALKDKEVAYHCSCAVSNDVGEELHTSSPYC
jgi:hypothetical protein